MATNSPGNLRCVLIEQLPCYAICKGPPQVWRDPWGITASIPYSRAPIAQPVHSLLISRASQHGSPLHFA